MLPVVNFLENYSNFIKADTFFYLLCFQWLMKIITIDLMTHQPRLHPQQELHLRIFLSQMV